MRTLTTVPFLVRSAIVVLLAFIAMGLLSGPAGLRPAPQSAEATPLGEVKKLLASDAGTAHAFGYSVAIDLPPKTGPVFMTVPPGLAA